MIGPSLKDFIGDKTADKSTTYFYRHSKKVKLSRYAPWRHMGERRALTYT
jgi:hypothetical protein